LLEGTELFASDMATGAAAEAAAAEAAVNADAERCLQDELEACETELVEVASLRSKVLTLVGRVAELRCALDNRDHPWFVGLRHPLRMRTLRLVVDACAAAEGASLADPSHLSLLQLFLVASAELCSLQEASLGPDHVDLARTQLDLSNGLRVLLREAPEVFQVNATDSQGELKSPFLWAFPLPEWVSISSARRAENKARRSHERIRALYA